MRAKVNEAIEKRAKDGWTKDKLQFSNPIENQEDYLPGIYLILFKLTESGPKNVSPDATPAELFHLFWDEIFSDIVECSNHKIDTELTSEHNLKRKKPQVHQRKLTWTAQKLLLYLALTLKFPLLPCQKLENYWSIDEDVGRK